MASTARKIVYDGYLRPLPHRTGPCSIIGIARLHAKIDKNGILNNLSIKGLVRLAKKSAESGDYVRLKDEHWYWIGNRALKEGEKSFYAEKGDVGPK